uniref:Calglandulin n=1 Tax=Macrostomum lignano TaxID=282301 RepID=A0A1I8H835_9PLAT
MSLATSKTEQEFPECKFSDFWVRKMRTFYRQTDAVGNGYLCLDDMIEISTTILDSFPKMNSFNGDSLVKAMIDFWFGFMCTSVDEHHRCNHQLLENDFIENMKRVVNTTFKEKFFESIVTPIFKAADCDEDGLISNLEFKTLMQAFKVIDRDSDTIFKIQDTDRKGKMSLATFRATWANYFFSEDQKIGLKVFGPLVNYKRPEDFGEVGCGPFWEGKMRCMFRRLDISGEGRISCQDFIQIARSLCQRGHLDRKKSNAVMRAILTIWVKYIALDKDGKHFASINEKDFIKNMRALINGEFRHEIDQFGWTFFKAVETSGDGYIQLQEYRNIQEAWGVSREEADGFYKVLDVDKDGRLSSDEYLNAWCDYFLGEDPQSKFRALFGPVITKPPEAR